jgi:hypothetical protein
MRTISDHVASPANEALSITVEDDPGQGGACHRYAIEGFDATNNPANTDRTPEVTGPERVTVMFQNGPIKEQGVNGITQEALLAIVIDRLRSFQEGPFRCRENAIALTHLEEALMWLQKRTRDRLARGVEGTNQK